MIPQFPQFKNLEISDKDDVEFFTKKFPPYSDFNFTSMWSWDTKGEMKISKLNNNLVVLFTDYITGEPFFSFLGNNEVNNTIEKLLEFSRKEGIKPELKLVPEDSIKGIDSSKYKIIEDRDNFDYILDLKRISVYDGHEYSSKRSEINYLLKNNLNVSFREVNLQDVDIQKKIISLFHKWVVNKFNNGKSYEENEELSFNKLILLSQYYKFVCTGVFVRDELVAFVVNELLDSGYSLGHASKANILIKGSNAYLMKGMSEILMSYGSNFLNYEQDLGILNLREGKRRFNPCFFLKKYKIKID